MNFLAEAVYYANYTLNLVLTYVFVSMTPIEKWCGKKPLVGHLRTFRCVAWARISDSSWNNIYSKSHACIMMGYSKESKSYEMFDPVKKQIIIRRNVIFNEKSSGNKLLNSYFGLFHSHPFDIVLDFESTVPLNIFTYPSISPPESTSSQSTWMKLLPLLINLIKGMIVHWIPIYLNGLLKLMNQLGFLW